MRPSNGERHREWSTRDHAMQPSVQEAQEAPRELRPVGRLVWSQRCSENGDSSRLRTRRVAVCVFPSGETSTKPDTVLVVSKAIAALGADTLRHAVRMCTHPESAAHVVVVVVGGVGGGRG